MTSPNYILLIGVYGDPIDCDASYDDAIVIRDATNRVSLFLSDKQLDALEAAIEQVRAYRASALQVAA